MLAFCYSRTNGYRLGESIPYMSEFSAELKSINNRTHGPGFEEGKEVLQVEEGAAGSLSGRRGSSRESFRQRREQLLQHDVKSWRLRWLYAFSNKREKCVRI